MARQLMEKLFLVVLVVTAINFFPLNISYAAGWERINIGSGVSEAGAIAIDKNGIIYVGFKEGLCKSINHGKDWELLGSPIIKEINFLYIDQQEARVIYAATKNGLFKTKDSGKNWQKIFIGKDAGERNVKSMAMTTQAPKMIFISTGAGLFFSPANRIIWQKVSGKLSDADIVFLAQDKNNEDTFYVVSNKGLFKTSDRMAYYERIHIGSNLESEDSVVDADNEEGALGDYFLRSLAIDPKNSSNLYIGTRKGLAASYNKGESFQSKEFSGLLDEKVNYILISRKDERFLLGTQNGVFDCRGDSCAHLYQGADFKAVSQLYLDEENNLYVATENGLFKSALRAKVINGINSYGDAPGKFLSKKEPSIRDIQKQAIEYAEVNPDKIKLWREQAAAKALLPKFTAGVNRNVTDLWHWESGSTTKTGDDTLTRGRDAVGWDVALSWDLGDLVWNSDQTSIDTRSRLMVQLRDDVLNEVTRLYFERKRLQMELADNLLSGKIKSEKELRLEELTAGIDGLTGGYLSRCLEEK